MKRYTVKRGTVVFTLTFLGLLTLVTLFGLLYAEPRIFFAALVLYLGWRWYQVARTPVEIRVESGGQVELRGLLGRTVLEAAEIELIRRAGRGYVLQHRGGSIPLYGGMERFNEFVLNVKAANPALEVRGF